MKSAKCKMSALRDVVMVTELGGCDAKRGIDMMT
jgi:hypothetical protein